MFAALVNPEFFKHFAAQTVFREHTLHGAINREVGFFRHDIFVTGFFKADIVRVGAVNFLCEFFARQHDFVAVYNNDMVSRINVRCEDSLVFAPENSGDLACQTAERHIGGVYDVPLSFNLGVGGRGIDK